MPALLNGSICHTTVQMTCVISNLQTLRWFIDANTQLISYTYSTGDESQVPITLQAPRGMEISIINAMSTNFSIDLFNATSTLTTNTTVLQAFNMQEFTCGNQGTRSAPVTVNFDILGEQTMHIISVKKCILQLY